MPLKMAGTASALANMRDGNVPIVLSVFILPLRLGGGTGGVGRSSAGAFGGTCKGDGIAHNGCHAPHQQERPRPPN